VSIAFLAAAACGTQTGDPQLTQIVPAAVTSLDPTAAVVQGTQLDALAKLDLDDHGNAKLDRGWHVRFDEVDALDPIWVDPQTIDVTIPGGLAIGVHDVIAISPDGRQLVLPHALTVSGEPLGLELSIEDAPGGAGSAVAGTVVAGAQVNAYAVVRDTHAAFVADVAVTWGTSAPLGTLSAGAGSSVVLTAEHAGTGRLTAHQEGAMLDAQSGDLVIIAGGATHIAIEDAPGGLGAVIGNRGGLTTDSDGGITAYAVSLDAFENFVADVPVDWTLTGLTGTLPLVAIATAAVGFATPGTAVLHADHATLGSAATGTLTVVAGRAALLTISPATQTLSADDPPLAFSATALDGKGNPTTNLGTLVWSVATGPITALDPATGILDPRAAGIGTIEVASSWGPTALSGAITILAGAPVAVVVSPPMLAISADAAPVAFTATITDSDGNPTSPGVLTWSIATGPISTIAPGTGVFDPHIAGTGTIAATATNGASGTSMVTVTPGHAAALAIAPNTLVASQGGAAVPFTVTATDGDGNATTDLGTIAWSIASGPIAAIDGATGILTPTAAGSGTIRAASSYGATATTGAIQILSGAALVPTINVPANVSVGETFSLAMTVTNPGQDAAANVTACALAITGTGSATIVSTPAGVPTIAGGGNAIMTWTLTATAAGSLSFTTCVNATDAVTSAPITAPASASATALVPPQLTATLTLPALLGRGDTFTATMVVSNSGQVTATGVTPSALATTGTGAVTLSSSPAGGASIGPGGNATFQWTYQATATGTLALHGSASGSDALSGATVTTPNTDSNTANIVEAYLASADPFGDGTAFGFVAGYSGEVYVGPNSTGKTAFRMMPDESSQTSLAFSFARDATGNSSANTSTPYTSIGAAGCTHNTSACGPDNEDERGLFTAVTFAGSEWLVQSGAEAALTGSYIYMTTTTASPLGFSYVDLSSALTSSYGASAIATVGNRLYVGTAGTNAGRSQLIAVTAAPSPPGLDTNGGNAVDMTLQNLGSWASGGNPGNVDAIADVGGLAYVANKNAWVRADVAQPVPMPNTCLLCCLLGCTIDWVDITPSAAAYGAKASRATGKGGQLEPPDRAVPAIVTFGGRVFAARNTTSGPQLWACTPTNSRCNSGDWSLVAANSSGDTQLTQFNDTGLTSITMLAATPSYLYVGFDSAAGLQIFRTSNPAATRAAFEGQAGCSAANHPASCAGYGGAGLGDVANTRIFDGKALTFGSSTAVWLTIGDGANPISLVTLP
jgi:hypothetical protein